MSADPSFLPYNYFAVASYEVAVRRYPDSNISAEGEVGVASVALTTEHNPGGNPGSHAAASSTRAVQPSLL
jgi:hypothetical protein